MSVPFDAIPEVDLATEVGNVHAFHDQSYSSKDRGKLRALLHFRVYFMSGHTPEDIVLAC